MTVDALVGEGLPAKQGLKLLAQNRPNLTRFYVGEGLPAKQGLKLFPIPANKLQSNVGEGLPAKQGLKRMFHGEEITQLLRWRGSSSKTRIETSRKCNCEAFLVSWRGSSSKTRIETIYSGKLEGIAA